MKRLILAAASLLVLALAGSIQAQSTGAVRGRVVDDKTQPVEGAKIECEFTGGVTRKYTLTSNKKGEFTQVGLSPGQYKLTATKDGYQGTFLQLRIQVGEATEVGDLKILPAAVARAMAGGKSDELATAFKSAHELVQAGKLDEAKLAYEAVVAKNPDMPQAYYNLAFVNVKKKDWPAAEAAYKKAIELRPDYGEAFAGLAEVYQNQGDAAQAAAVLSGAATAQPQNGRLQYELGVLYLRQNKHAEAAPALEKAAELDPSNTDSLFQLGSVYLNLNNAAKAVESYEKYLATKPTDAQKVATATSLVSALKPKP